MTRKLRMPFGKFENQPLGNVPPFYLFRLLDYSWIEEEYPEFWEYISQRKDFFKAEAEKIGYESRLSALEKMLMEFLPGDSFLISNREEAAKGANFLASQWATKHCLVRLDELIDGTGWKVVLFASRAKHQSELRRGNFQQLDLRSLGLNGPVKGYLSSGT